MQSLSFSDISKYLSEPLKIDFDLLSRVEVYIRVHLGHTYLDAFDFDYANCSRIEMYFDKQWNPTKRPTFRDESYPSRQEEPIGGVVNSVSIYISSRGPLITSYGSEWNMQYDGLLGEDRFGFHASLRAGLKAKEMAYGIAEEFDLIYLDRDWLRQFKIKEEDLPDDAAGTIELDDPDAMAVLFSECA